MYKGVKVSKEQIDTEVTHKTAEFRSIIGWILLQIESLAKGRTVAFKKRKFSSMRGAVKEDGEMGDQKNAISAESKDS